VPVSSPHIRFETVAEGVTGERHKAYVATIDDVVVGYKMGGTEVAKRVIEVECFEYLW
jgi:hypothetical protein